MCNGVGRTFGVSEVRATVHGMHERDIYDGSICAFTSIPLTNTRHKLLKRYSFQRDERIPHPHIRHKSSRDVDHEQQGPLLAGPGAAQKLMTADWRVL